MAPEGISRCERPYLAFPSLARSMPAQNTSDAMTQMARLCGAPKDEYAPNHRGFETRNQAGGDNAGGELDCARALSEMAQTARPHS